MHRQKSLGGPGSDVVHRRAGLGCLARDHVGDRRAGEDLAGGGGGVGEDAVRVAAERAVEELDDLERGDLAGGAGERVAALDPALRAQDPGSAQNGGDLGFIVKGQTVPPFEKFAFSAKPNEISDLVTTEYGYHIIQMEEKQPARVKPFEEVKDSIAEQLKKQGVNEKMQSTVDQARAALLKAPASAADVAKQFGLDVITVKDAKAGEPIPSLGPAPEITSALAGMKANDVSDSLLISGNKIAIVVLDQKTPPAAAQFSDVEAQVRDRYITNASISLSNQAALKANPRHTDYRAYYRNSLVELTQSYAGLGDRTAALATATKRSDLGWNGALDAYEAACMMALCVPIVEKDDKLDEAQRQAETEFYAGQAIVMLRESVARGYRDAAHMKQDKYISAIHENAEFKKVVAELEAKLKN